MVAALYYLSGTPTSRKMVLEGVAAERQEPYGDGVIDVRNHDQAVSRYDQAVSRVRRDV